MIWQLQVTVRNKETQAKYVLSTWVQNERAKINVGL
jgi:hypothetical protein